MTKSELIARYIKRRYKIDKIDYAIVVGSGLMDAVPDLEDITIVPYSKLRMPKSKVKGHSGKFIFGTYKGKKVVLVSRIHYYESGNMKKVKLVFETVAHLGAKNIVLLTSCGGINKTFKVGDIMIIKDHVNFSGINPLIGSDPIEFVPMENAYDKGTFNKLLEIAKKNNIDVRHGVHIQFTGPSYETMAEIEVARNMGADTVSMSTVFDCIICNSLKMKVCAIASVVNVFNNSQETEGELNHQEVLENAKLCSNKIKTLITGLLEE